MAKDWYLMPQTQKNSGFERSEFFDYADDYLNEVLEESFLSVDVVLYQNGNLDESAAVYTKAVVQENTPARISFFDKRQIITRIGLLKIGNYVRFENDIYIIIEPPGNNQVYEKCWMQLCNCDIGWINDSGEEVRAKSVFYDSTRFSSGENENRSLILGDMRIEIFMPKNKETIKIPRGKRFIVDDYDRAQFADPLVYRVTKVNIVEKHKNGDAMLIFIMTEDSFDEAADDREKMIADYYKSLNQYSLELITPENIQVEKGSSVQIQYAAKINNNIAANGVIFSSENESAAFVSTDGMIEGLDIGTSRIKLTFNSLERIINTEIVEVKTGVQDTCRITYSGGSKLKIGGGAKTFKAVFFDSSGNEMSDTAQWHIYGQNGSDVSSFITSTPQTDNSIKLKCANDYRLKGKIIYLKLTGAGGLPQDILPVELVSLT